MKKGVKEVFQKSKNPKFIVRNSGSCLM